MRRWNVHNKVPFVGHECLNVHNKIAFVGYEQQDVYNNAMFIGYEHIPRKKTKTTHIW